MTFNPSVPNASEAPNLLPAQNSANFTQLRKIIVADHQFNNTAQANDGFHNQCTMINRSAPGSLPSGANGIFYSFLDANSQSQLSWYNGTTDHILTPYDELLPIRIVGSAGPVLAGDVATIFPDPGYDYMGTGFVYIASSFVNKYQSIFCRGSGQSIKDITSQTGAFSRPEFVYSTRDLQVMNNDGSTRTLLYSIIINRVT
jgi:hypothetical protein